MKLLSKQQSNLVREELLGIPFMNGLSWTASGPNGRYLGVGLKASKPEA